jgi:hypothetical protein
VRSIKAVWGKKIGPKLSQYEVLKNKMKLPYLDSRVKALLQKYSTIAKLFYFPL